MIAWARTPTVLRKRVQSSFPFQIRSEPTREGISPIVIAVIVDHNLALPNHCTPAWKKGISRSVSINPDQNYRSR